LLARPVVGGPDARPEVQRIIHESDRAARIVRKLLTFAQPHQPQMEPVNLNQIVAEVLETQTPALHAVNITVQQDLDPDLKKTVADPGQVEEVISNLVLNAIQAMESHNGARTLTVVTEQDELVQRIIVTDSGPGISLDVLGKIFDPFFTTKAPGKGTGLGLSICYSMIQEHHGRIWAENVPGGGARFLVELPYVPYEDVIAAPAAPPAPRPAPAPDAAQRRLLVVDDEPGIVEVLRSTLESSGYTVETACNGNEAMKQLAANNYDLIISDLCMPGMDGEALYNNVKAINPELAKRIIFVTGDTVSEKSRRFIDGTGNRWLGKPFNLVEIEELVTGVLCGAPVDFSKN